MFSAWDRSRPSSIRQTALPALRRACAPGRRRPQLPLSHLPASLSSQLSWSRSACLSPSRVSGPIGDWDLSVGRWFELHRTTALNGWTNIASVLGGTGTILLVAGLVVGFLLIRRLWYEAGFLVTGLFIEFAVFLTTSSLVDRPRPTTRPLDTLPVTSSYPSGHVAASIMLYIGWAIITSAQTRSTLARVAIWAFAVLFPICVGLSRIYRGMHHPTDVAASIVLGTGALVFSIYAIRVAAAAAERRRGQHPRRESAEVRA
jgi:membrane-associated phospholipid phosphatase